MITTATEVQHELWCNKHQDEESGAGCCEWEAKVGESFVNVDVEDGRKVVTVWSGGGRDQLLSPSDAVEVAARTIEAASFAAGHAPTTAAIHRGLVRAIGHGGPFEVDAIEVIADALGVSVVDLLR